MGPKLRPRLNEEGRGGATGGADEAGEERIPRRDGDDEAEELWAGADPWLGEDTEGGRVAAVVVGAFAEGVLRGTGAPEDRPNNDTRVEAPLVGRILWED